LSNNGETTPHKPLYTVISVENFTQNLSEVHLCQNQKQVNNAVQRSKHVIAVMATAAWRGNSARAK